MRENELYHFGIPGMKWGVRRYQNEDGTLTDAGRSRYASSKGPSRGDIRRARRAANIAAAAEAGHEYDKKYASQLYEKADRARAKGNTRKADRLTRKADRLIQGNEKGIKMLRDQADKAAAVVRAKGGTDEMLAPKKTNTAAQVAKVGAAVAGTALLAYGIYKMADMSDTQTRATRARVDQILQECAADPIAEGIRRAEAQKSSETASSSRGAFGPDSKRMAEAMKDIGNTSDMFKDYARREREFRDSPEMKRFRGSMNGGLGNAGTSRAQEDARGNPSFKRAKVDPDAERRAAEARARNAADAERMAKEARARDAAEERERANIDPSTHKWGSYAEYEAWMRKYGKKKPTGE